MHCLFDVGAGEGGRGGRGWRRRFKALFEAFFEAIFLPNWLSLSFSLSLSLSHSFSLLSSLFSLLSSLSPLPSPPHTSDYLYPPRQALAEPFPSFSQNLTSPRVLLELNVSGATRCLEPRTGKFVCWSVSPSKNNLFLKLVPGVKPSRFPTNSAGLPGWGAHVNAGFARTSKYEAPSPLPVRARRASGGEEGEAAERVRAFKVVACVSGRFVALNSYSTTFAVGLTTRAADGKKGILAFTSRDAAVRWIRERGGGGGGGQEGSPKAVLECEAVGGVER